MNSKDQNSIRNSEIRKAVFDDLGNTYTDPDYYQTAFKKLIKYLSQCFQVKITNVKEATTEIGNMILKMHSINDKLKESKKQIKLLSSEIENYKANEKNRPIKEEIQTPNSDLQQNNFSDLQNQIEKLKADLNQRDTYIKSLNSKLVNSESKIQNLSSQILKLQAQKPSNGTDAKSITDAFEDLLMNQESMINDLNNQKTKLLSTITQYDTLFQNLSRMKMSQKSDDVLKLQYQSLLAKTKDQESEIRKLLPSDVLLKVNNSPNFAVEAIKLLISQLTAKSKQKDNNTVPKRQYIDLLTHFENVIGLIRNIADKNYLSNGDEVTAVLKIQCKSISNFIRTKMVEIGIQNLPAEYNIFDAHAFTSPEDQLKVFLQFVTEDDLQTSPLRDLFALFRGICNLNSMLIAYNDRIERNTVDVAVLDQKNKLIEKLHDDYDLLNYQKENFEIKSNQLEIRNKELIKKNTELESKLGNIKISKNEDLQNLQCEISKLKEENRNLKGDMHKMASDQTKKQQIYNLENEKSQIHKKCTALESDNAVLKSHIAELQTLILQQQKDFEIAMRHKDSKYNRLASSTSTTQDTVDAINQRSQKLIKENEFLVEQVLRLQDQISRQNDTIRRLQGDSQQQQKYVNSRK